MCDTFPRGHQNNARKSVPDRRNRGSIASEFPLGHSRRYAEVFREESKCAKSVERQENRVGSERVRARRARDPSTERRLM